MTSMKLELRKVAPSSSMLERSAQVLEDVLFAEEVVAFFVRVRLQAGFSRLPKELRTLANPDAQEVTCNLESWVETGSGEEIAYCHGVYCPESKALALRWIGRSEGKSVHEQVRGQRCVNVGEAAGASPNRTIAEALIGLLSSLGEQLGARQLRLQALDTGSGKLVKFYAGLGFTALPLAADDDNVDMICNDLPSISSLMPPCWLVKLNLPESDLQTWLQQSIRHYQGLESVGSATLPWTRQWEDAFGKGPARIKVLMEASAELRDGQAHFKVELSTSFCSTGELALVLGTVEEGTDLLVIKWIGRTRRRPVHQLIRSTMAFEGPHGKVTIAMALLGVLVVLARGYGARRAQIDVLDNPRYHLGRLETYLKGFGFREVKPNLNSSEEEFSPYPRLQISCETLAGRCCPWVWRVRLPPPGTFHGAECVNAESSECEKAEKRPVTQPSRLHAENIST